jgi:hypothetical protein
MPIGRERGHLAKATLRRADESERDWWEPDLGPSRPVQAPMLVKESLVSRILRDLRAA